MSSRRKFYMVTNAGTPATGQSPGSYLWVKSDGNPPAPSAPVVAEVGNGIYTFEVPADLDADAVYVIDNDPGGSTGIPAAERYTTFQILLTDHNLGPMVRWAHPRGEPRGIFDAGSAEGHYTCYVYLEGRDGEPLTGVTDGDLETLEWLGLGEMSAQITRSIDPTAVSWGEIGAAFPGMYSFRLDNNNGGAGDLGGARHHYVSIRLTADTGLTHVWSMNGDGSSSSSGGGGDDGDFIGVFALMLQLFSGTNGVYEYTSFAADGNPTSGRLDTYMDATAADDRDAERLIYSTDVSFEYDGMGRLSSQSRTLDETNQAALFAYLSQFAGGGDGGDGGDGGGGIAGTVWLVPRSDVTETFFSEDGVAFSASGIGIDSMRAADHVPSGGGDYGLYVMAGINGVVAQTAAGGDLSSWSVVSGLLGETDTFNDIAVLDDGMGSGYVVAVGDNGLVAWCAVNEVANAASWNSTTVAGNPDFTSIDTDGVEAFIATGSDGPYWANTGDLSSWAQCTMNSAVAPVWAVTHDANLGGGGEWIIISQAGVVEAQSTGTTPTAFGARGTGLPTHCRDVDVAPDGTLCAVGGDTLASWSRASGDDGANWSDTGAPTPGQVARRIKWGETGGDTPLSQFLVVGDASLTARQSLPLSVGDGWTKATLGGGSDLLGVYGPQTFGE